MTVDIYASPFPVSLAFPSSQGLERYPDPDPCSTLAMYLDEEVEEVLTLVVRPQAHEVADYREALRSRFGVLFEVDGDEIADVRLRFHRASHSFAQPIGGWPRSVASMKRIVGRWGGYGAIGLWPASSPGSTTDEPDPADALSLELCEIHFVRKGYVAAEAELNERLSQPGVTFEAQMQLQDAFHDAWS